MEKRVPDLSFSDLPLAVLSLCLALFVYALTGSPTPDHPGVSEALTGILLISAVLAAFPSLGASFLQERSTYLKTVMILFVTGLVLPTVAGVYLGNDRMLMLRDVLAFAFLGLPLFLSDSFANRPQAARLLCALVVFAGVAFCVRTLIPAFNIWIPQGELLYLSNSPLSLFAAVFLAGTCWTLLESPTQRNIVIAVLCLAGLAVIMAAMMLDVQRATVGAVWITWVMLAVYGLLFHPRRVLCPLLLIGGLCVLSFPILGDVMEALAVKTSQVGLNARLAEAWAVYEALASYPPSLIAGLGWGASFASPAVAGLPVNFTHSLLTTMALKGGIILFSLSLALTVAALHQIFLIFQRDRVLGLALFWAFSIPVFLYASHKSLDFGVVLLMIGMWSTGSGPLHKSHSSGKTEEHP